MASSSFTEEIRTARLSLVPFGVHHMNDAYIGWLNDPEIVRYSEQRHRKHTCETCLAYVSSFDQMSSHLWAIFDQSARHIGNISAHRDIPNQTANVGILIGDASAHGKGYGSEAWRAACEWLFETGTRKVTAGTMACNRPMLKVFEKTGMQVEGRRTAEFLLDGMPVDLVQVARFRSQWRREEA